VAAGCCAECHVADLDVVMNWRFWSCPWHAPRREISLRPAKLLEARQRFPDAQTAEIEGALAVQMSRTRAAAMAILGKLDSGFGTEQRICGLRGGGGSFNEDVCDASGGLSTLA